MKTFCDSPPVRLIDPIPLEKVSVSRETFSRGDIDSNPSFHKRESENGRIERKRTVLPRSTRIRYNERVRSPRFKRRDASSISLSAVNHNSCDATRFFIFKSLRKRIAPTNIIIRAFRAIGVEKMRQYPFNIDIPSNCFVKPRSVIFHKKNPPVDRDDHARARARDISFPVLF